MEEIIRNIIHCLGDKENIIDITNCMTRLRVEVKDDSKIEKAALKDIDTVLSVVSDRKNNIEIVVGPGKSTKYAKACKDYLENSIVEEKIEKPKFSFNNVFKTMGDIFVPLIPGIIVSGICSGLSSLLSQVYPSYMDSKLWGSVYLLLNLVSTSFMTYITAWAGYRSAERLKATPILGGMLGMIISLDGINTFSSFIGLSNDINPLESILRSGRGGVLAAVICSYLMSIVERKIRSKIPEALDTVFSPLLTIFICLIPLVFIIMPILGYVSSFICQIIGFMCLSDSILIRMFTGFISAAIFLPLVANGMHHGLIALYTIQLETLGYITLYPALAMAGAGQVGAAIAIRMKAKKDNNIKMVKTIDGSLFAGILGVGEPLIYGVTMPLGTPFFTAGLGAGIGGAFLMALRVGSTSWGPSGILGAFVMTAGPSSPIMTIVFYLIGYAISVIFGFLITSFVSVKIKEREEIYRCCSGEIVKMEDIPDKVFSSGDMGESFGIIPTEDFVYAPQDGTIEVIASTGHSFCLNCKDKTKLLVHVGIDTVYLNGKGFNVFKKVGDKVKKGDKVIEFDSEVIKKANYSNMIVVVKLKS